jgi:hypothetical protein
MRRAQTSAAFSSNGNILPLNSDCGPSAPANHASNRSRFLPFGLSSMPRRISAIDFSDRQGGDEQIAIGLHTHPFQQRFGRVRLRYIADDICVEKVAGQRPTLRPVSLERANSRSALPAATGAAPQEFRLSSADRPRSSGRWPMADGGSDPGRIWAIFREAPRDGADQVTICVESEHLESGDPPLRQTGAIISQRSLLCGVAHSSGISCNMPANIV